MTEGEKKELARRQDAAALFIRKQVAEAYTKGFAAGVLATRLGKKLKPKPRNTGSTAKVPDN